MVLQPTNTVRLAAGDEARSFTHRLTVDAAQSERFGPTVLRDKRLRAA
jgi:hypothetical protein